MSPTTPTDSANAAAASATAERSYDLVVLGAGPGGYSAAFRAADLGLKTLLVERYPTLGGVCLNVGCIPSKALLHHVAVIDEVRRLLAEGIVDAVPRLDLEGLRRFKLDVVQRLTNGLSGMARARRVDTLRGVGRFIDEHHLEIACSEGEGRATTGEQVRVRFAQAIIAAGSRPTRLPFLPEDPRIVDSTGALALQRIPEKLLVIGGGIIGLEMGTVYSTLGARLDVVEMLDELMPGVDRDLFKVWQKMNAHRFDQVLLSTRVTAVEARDDGLWVRYEGETAPSEPQRYDMILVSAGRVPNGGEIGAETAGVQVSERGFIGVDAQMRTNVPHIFAIGDIAGAPMLAHKAVHEGHVAAEVAAGHKSFFDARVIPSVAYTDPEVAWVGMSEREAERAGVAVETAIFPWAASGRAIANGRDEGLTKLIFDPSSKRIIGGAIVGTHAGDLLGEICLAIEMGADAVDLARTIHAHPTLGESIGLAGEVQEDTCTDLPPRRRKAP